MLQSILSLAHPLLVPAFTAWGVPVTWIEIVAFAVSLDWWLLPAVPAVGYLVAGAGHAAFEGNRPTTFRHPWYSLLADLVMFKDMLTGKITF